MTSDDVRAVVATCHGVVRVFGSGTQETTALRGIDVTVHGGVVTVVAGPSGSGKTSLLRLLAVQDRPRPASWRCSAWTSVMPRCAASASCAGAS